MNRIDNSSLRSLPAPVIRPGYQRDEHGAGIVHIGTGSFHRAHQAVYTDTALRTAGGDWRIIGSSLRSRAVSDQLNAQDGLYTLVSQDSDGAEVRIVGALGRVIFAPDHPAALIDAIAHENTRIVTLTVTEKGYCYDPAKSGLDLSNDLIIADLQRPEAPQSAPGFLVAGLRSRWRQSCGPITILSCDNLPDNGAVTQTVVLQLAAAFDPELARWITHNVTFPSSMVDRIVPATTDTGRQYVAEKLGVIDQCPVLTEAFSQWVIEENFAAGRPAWETGGATFVADVAPFEKMKLRLLNGSHSAIAYLGYVAGFEYVHDVMANPAFRALLRHLMDNEVTPTLDMPDTNLDDYKDQLIRRFADASLNHQTRQIAMDGSQKLPQRLLEPIREGLAAGRPIDCLVLSVAAWMRYVSGPDDSGKPIEVDDPFVEEFTRIRQRHSADPPSIAKALLEIRPIFGDQLPANSNFTRQVSNALTDLMRVGVMATMESTLNGIAGTAER